MARRFTSRLPEFEDFLADEHTGAKWLNATRAFLRHVRTFFLYKEGFERTDSRSGRSAGAPDRGEAGRRSRTMTSGRRSWT